MFPAIMPWSMTGGGDSKVGGGGSNNDGAGCGSEVGGGRPISFRTYAGIKGKP
jgi:hypothetical protein